MASTNLSFKGDKLIGRSNFLEWKKNATLFLEIGGYMPYLDGTKLTPDKSLYFDGDKPRSIELNIKYIDKLSEFEADEKKALGALKLIISPDNVDRFKDKNSALLLWGELNKIYGETSLDTIARYFNKIISAEYSEYATVDEYTSTVQSAALYLKELGYSVPEPLLACILFKGLPSSFEAFASRKHEELAKDIKNINITQLISDIISEEARLSTSVETLGSANKVSKLSNAFCSHCKLKGHLIDTCFKLHPELKPKKAKKGGKKSKDNNKGKSNNKDKKENKKDSSSGAVMMVSAINNNNNIQDIKSKMVLDSGASEHYTHDKNWLLNIKPIINKSIKTASGQILPVLAQGNLPVLTPNGSNIIIKDVFYVPRLKFTLISSKELANKGWEILFKSNTAKISNPKFKHIKLNADWLDNAYYLNLDVDYNKLEPVVYSALSEKRSELDLVHQRLNHLNKDLLFKTLDSTTGLKTPASTDSLSNCDFCYLGKFTEKGSKTPMGTADPLTLFDVDLCGPITPVGFKGERYFITFTCRGSRAAWVYALKYKSEAFDAIINFVNMIKTQFNVVIKAFHCDNAKELKSKRLGLFAKEMGILFKYTSPYSPAQNGIAERLNRYIIERLIAICKAKNIPLFLWPYLIESIIHIKNRTYNSIINKTPVEAILNKKPDIHYLRVLGSLCYILVPKEKRKDGKLSEKASTGLLIGYESNNNFLVYIPSTRKVISTKNIIIKEELEFSPDYQAIPDGEINEFSSLLDQIGPIGPSRENFESDDLDLNRSSPDLNNNNQSNIDDIDELNEEFYDKEFFDASEIADMDGQSEIELNTPSLPSKASRGGRAAFIINSLNNETTELGPNISHYCLASMSLISHKNELNNKDDLDPEESKYHKVTLDKNTDLPVFEPKTYSQAINSSTSVKWDSAMKKELKMLHDNNTFDLVPRPKEVKVLNARWVYKLKDFYKDYYEFKARFVAKGFEQLYGIDYIDTFAGVIKGLAWRLIFALAVQKGWPIYKIDMIGAFIQGEIDNNIYLNQPEGYINENKPNYVFKLNKALYGLKQSARIWYNTLKEVLINKLGFRCLSSENSVFINDKTGIIITVYVDDLAIVGPNEEVIKEFITLIKTYFDIKNLGPIKDYLGIEVNYDIKNKRMKLHQTKYINKMLNKFKFDNINPSKTPMDSSAKYEPNAGQASKEDIKLFQQFIGSLLFLALATRCDICYATIRLARYASNPSEIHFRAVKRIFRYLKGTSELGIIYYNSPEAFIQGYCDADYAGDLASAKSTSGYIIFIAGGPFMWKSKLQSIIAQSTTEAEYIAINLAAKELAYIRILLKELGLASYDPNIKLPLYTDNQGALQLAKNPIYHERTKHIAVKYHYIRDLINKRILDLIWVPTVDQKADGFTKALNYNTYTAFITQLGLA
jgi:hypothetical protein